MQDDILMWGGYGGRETRPQQVVSNWSLAAEFMPNFTLMVIRHFCNMLAVQCNRRMGVLFTSAQSGSPSVCAVCMQ